MLKESTIKELEETFQAESVEVLSMDLIRIHINERGSKTYLKEIINILKNNSERGPLKLHEEAAKSFNCLFYIDIIQI